MNLVEVPGRVTLRIQRMLKGQVTIGTRSRSFLGIWAAGTIRHTYRTLLSGEISYNPFLSFSRFWFTGNRLTGLAGSHSHPLATREVP